MPKEIIKDESAKEILDIINLVKSLKLRLMMSRKLGEWVVINTDELYRQLIAEARKQKLSVLENENEENDKELIAAMQRENAINIFFSMFVPGFNVFTEAYHLRCEDGHREEGELKEEEGKFKFVSDVTKGKGKELNLKMNMDMYFKLRKIYDDTYINDMDSVVVDSVEGYNIEMDTIATDDEDSLLYEDWSVLCKAQNIIDVKMDKKSWLKEYENTVIINYPNGVGTIYQVLRRRND